MLVQQNGAELGETLGCLLELAEDNRALVDRQRKQAHAVGERALEPVGEVDSAGRSDEFRELSGRVTATGTPAIIIAARLAGPAAEFGET